jgi:type IV pilus assembly protein PilX
MTTRAFRNRIRHGSRLAQRGVVLFIALIVLVAMSLAGIAIMRSVDTGNLIAGNVAFKQGTLASADRGIDEAFTYLKNNALGADLETDQPSEAYFAAASDPPDWSEDSVWSDARVVGTDAAGNTISYVVHRMCDGQGKYSGVNCAQTPRTGGKAGNSMSVMGNQFTSTPVVYYRVTVRVQGPRDTLSIVQSNIGIQH